MIFFGFFLVFFLKLCFSYKCDNEQQDDNVLYCLYPNKTAVATNLLTNFENGLTFPNSINIDNNSYDVIGISFSKPVNVSGVLILPSFLQFIEQESFQNTKITMIQQNFNAKTIDRIEGYAFNSCFELEYVQIKCLKIGKNAFSECYALQLIAIDNCEDVDIYAFANSGVEIAHLSGYIHHYAFYNCTALETVALTSNNNILTTLENPFYNCTSLVTISCDVGNFVFTSYESEYDLDFYDIIITPNLKEIHIENSIVTFDNHAYKCLTFPDEITLVNSTIKEIGYYAFQNSKIKTINLDEQSSIINVKTGAFMGCTSLNISLKITGTIDSYAFSKCDEAETLLITASTINDFAFSNCAKIRTVQIAPTVSYIGFNIIDQCPKFNSLQFLNLSFEGNPLVIGENAFWKITSFDLISQLPDRLHSIGERGFSGCTGLTGSLILPKSLEIIKESAFQGCLNLNGFLDFSHCEKLIEIGKCAFLGCRYLNGPLLLPNNLKIIGEYAFTDCRFSGPLIIPDSVIDVGNNAFAKCTTFSGSLVIGLNVERIFDFAFAECSGLNGQLDITSTNLKSIGKNAFYGCIGLTGILYIPQSVVIIDDFAFFNCKGFKNQLTLPENLQKIGDSAFAFCTGLSGVLAFPQKITSIGANAFFGCTELSEIYFPSKYTLLKDSSELYIGDKAFGNLHIKCLSKVPPQCSRGNSSNVDQYQFVGGDTRCYDTDGFDWISTTGTIGENCQLYKALSVFTYVCITLFSLGIFGFVSRFLVSYIQNRKTISKRLKNIFCEVITKTKKAYENNDNELEAVNQMINKLNDKVADELNDPKFNLHEKKVKNILLSSIDEIWPTISYSNKRRLLEKSFDGLNIDENTHKQCTCSCIKCSLSKKSRRSDDSLQPLDTSLI